MSFVNFPCEPPPPFSPSNWVMVNDEWNDDKPFEDEAIWEFDESEQQEQFFIPNE